MPKLLFPVFLGVRLSLSLSLSLSLTHTCTSSLPLKTIGIRDSRKIVGQYDLTRADVFNEARFDDTVGIFPEFIDG